MDLRLKQVLRKAEERDYNMDKCTTKKTSNIHKLCRSDRKYNRFLQ